jgi:hypothetical protein
MKARSSFASAVAGLVVAGATTAAAVEYPRVSTKATVTQVVGVTDVTINYCRPSVRGRAIWGSLVPFDKVWRTGANEATTITFGDEITVGDAKLPAGTYGLFTIPGREEWTIVFNKGAKQWGAFNYNAADDVLRVKVKPQANSFTELMTFAFTSVGATSAEVTLTWEKLRVAFTLKVDTVGKLLPQARAAVAEAKPDDLRTPLSAAIFCLDNNVNLDEAGTWIEKSLAVKETPYGVVAKARLLAAKGQKTEAIATAKRGIASAKAADPNSDTAWIEALIAEWAK